MNAYPNIPTEWVGTNASAPIPKALNGQFGLDSDDPIEKYHELYSIEEDFDSINNDMSLSRALSVMMEENIPAQDERWSPDGSDEDT
eukprot:1775514-Pyramimonas_sp.AAC.1